MAIKKSELYSSLWEACNDLRGGIEPAAYKDYVLVLLFIKYVSDKYAGQPYAEITVPEGASFADMVKLKGNPEIGDLINKRIITPLAEANKLGNLPDFNDSQKLGSGKEMQDRLTNLIAVFEKKELNFSQNRADGDDILGDAYEYLMRHFASESGKSKGQFYTPSEVSRIMALVLGIGQDATSSSTTVYDPTCGSGSLLLKVGDAAAADVTLYGQEYDQATAALAQMNMILHDNPTAQIMQGNTLANPKFMEQGSLKTFDYVVANPPFSDKRWSNGLTPEQDIHERFQHYGTPPDKQGDYAYMLHIIRSLKSNGKAAVVLPHGVLFRGNAEETIRKNILRRGYIKAIIGLPANLFYGTGIPACIIVLDKSQAANRDTIFMINASDGFMKDGPKNRLRELDVRRIIDTYQNGADVAGYARNVQMAEIINHGFNLNLPRYIASNKAEDIQDIGAHLNGGIPQADIDALEGYWQVFANLRQVLLSPERQGYLAFNVATYELNETISSHPDYKAFEAQAAAHYHAWQSQVVDGLKALPIGMKPKQELAKLAEGLLVHYKGQPLIDPYDIYQLIMDYWEEVLSDDFYQIAAEGWKAEPYRVIELIKQGKKKGQEKDIGWACDLLPKPLLVSYAFADEQADLDAKQAELESAEAALTEMVEEQSNDDGVFSDFEKVNAKEVNTRIKEINGNVEFEDELDVLKEWVDETRAVAALKKQVKAQDEALDKAVLDYYPNPTEAEVKEIVVNNKWLASLEVLIAEANQTVLQNLARQLKELAERYETPLPQLQQQTEELSAQVEQHLKAMGFSWK
ncbi:type I restriction-modification system subunit M [Alphaproteobacteria bacterium]|nr:type I restriction-modification system subunit M [Alphaproteobacteria bacterium]